MSNDIIFKVLWEKRGGQNPDPRKCNFTTPPVTSSCFANLLPSVVPRGVVHRDRGVSIYVSPVDSGTGTLKSPHWVSAFFSEFKGSLDA